MFGLKATLGSLQEVADIYDLSWQATSSLLKG